MEALFIEGNLVAYVDKEHFILRIEVVPSAGAGWSEDLSITGVIRLQAAINTKFKLEGKED